MSYNPQNPNGQATMANSAPVVVASDQSAIPVSVSGVSTAADQTNGNQKTQIVDGSGNVISSTSNALNVNVTNGGQTVKLSDGTNTANVGLGDANNGFLYTGAGHMTQTFSISSVSAGTSYDVGNYRWVSVQFTSAGASGASTSFQISNDNTNFIVTALEASGSVAVNATLTATGSAGAAVYHGPLTGRYFRLNVTALPSGTVAGTIVFSTQPAVLQSYGVAVSQQTSPWISTLQPSTSGGWSISIPSPTTTTGITNTLIAAKATAGQVGGYMFYNPNTSVSYVQVFNVASGSVTLGTTSANLVIPVPPGGAANVEFANGIAFSTAITWAATSSLSANTAPASALNGFLLYK